MSESLRTHELELERVLNVVQAYQEPRILLTACELDLFSILCDRPVSAEQIAQPRGWDVHAVRVLLDALTVMGFVDKTLDKYTIAHVNRALLSADDSRGVVALMRMAAAAWPAWSALTERVTRGVHLPPFDAAEAQVDSNYAQDVQLAPGIAALVRPETGRSFLDVGGSSGAYTCAFLARNRALQASLLVEPSQVSHTRRRLDQSDCGNYVNLIAGDVMSQEWPGNHDLIFLSAVIHNYSSECCESIYRHAFQSLNCGGRLVVRDHVMSENRLRPRTGSMMSVHLLVATPHGQMHAYSEIRRGMEHAGFVDVRLIQDGERMNGLVEAFKPLTS